MPMSYRHLEAAAKHVKSETWNELIWLGEVVLNSHPKKRRKWISLKRCHPYREHRRRGIPIDSPHATRLMDALAVHVN